MACYHADCSYSFIESKYETGNFDLTLIKKHLSKSILPKHTKLIIICAHLHGIVMDMKNIRKFCDQNKMLIIEDCAQSILSNYEHDKSLPIGSYGDFSVYSFGSTKPLSLGSGGILCSHNSSFYDDYSQIADSTLMPEFMDSDLYRQQYYQAYELYLKQRNNTRLHVQSLQKLLKCWSGYFCRSEQLQSLEKIKIKLSETTTTAEFHKSVFKNYKQYLKSTSAKVNIVKYREGDCPWRFSFFVKENKYRDKLLSKLWNLKLPANRWYPSLPDLLLQDASSFKESRRHADSIVNIPLDSSKYQLTLSTIKEIDEFLNE